LAEKRSFWPQNFFDGSRAKSTHFKQQRSAPVHQPFSFVATFGRQPVSAAATPSVTL
jgi:hypothetical protein